MQNCVGLTYVCCSFGGPRGAFVVQRRHFEREHKRFVAMCRVWWKVGRALKHDDDQQRDKQAAAKRAQEAALTAAAAPPDPTGTSTGGGDEEKTGGGGLGGGAGAGGGAKPSHVLEWDHVTKSLIAKPSVAEENLDPWTVRGMVSSSCRRCCVAGVRRLYLWTDGRQASRLW